MPSEFRPLPGIGEGGRRTTLKEQRTITKVAKPERLGDGGLTRLDRALDQATLRRTLDGVEIGRRLRELEGA